MREAETIAYSLGAFREFWRCPAQVKTLDENSVSHNPTVLRYILVYVTCTSLRLTVFRAHPKIKVAGLRREVLAESQLAE